MISRIIYPQRGPFPNPQNLWIGFSLVVFKNFSCLCIQQFEDDIHIYVFCNYPAWFYLNFLDLLEAITNFGNYEQLFFQIILLFCSFFFFFRDSKTYIFQIIWYCPYLMDVLFFVVVFFFPTTFYLWLVIWIISNWTIFIFIDYFFSCF